MASNIMSLVKASNKKRLNPYDLSYKHAYTSKLGQILPFHVQPVFPGDKFKFNVEDFTRTLPADSSAYARLRKNIEFYFVPFHSLWRYWDSFISDVEMRHSAESLLDVGTGPVKNFPVTTYYDVCKVLQRFLGKNSSGNPNYSPIYNSVGLNRAQQMIYLLQLLHYGDFQTIVDQNKNTAANEWIFDFEKDNGLVNSLKKTPFNPAPLLAYQRIFNDHFRFSQWLLSSPSCFNLDYVTPDSASGNYLSLSPIYNESDKNKLSNYNMFDLHYAFYRKDLFKGILPTAQYGDEAVLTSPISGDPGNYISFSNSYYNVNDASAIDEVEVFTKQVQGQAGRADLISGTTDTQGNPIKLNKGVLSGITASHINASFGILALRKATALQRRKEIILSNKYDYKSQVRAHWGSTPSSDNDHQSRYLGGFSFDISFDEVVNTNLANASDMAEIRGKGIGSSSGSFKCSFDDYGILIGVQYKEPLLDYANIGKNMLNTFRSSDDFPIPEFDSLGMEVLPYYRQAAFTSPTASLTGKLYPTEPDRFMGYVPRYSEFKTSVDIVSGAFLGPYSNWVVKETLQDFYYNIDSQYRVHYGHFLIKPNLLDNLFAVNVDGTNDTDQFLDNTFIGVKSLRNFDRNGLPY